jgi:hypothetical protein
VIAIGTVVGTQVAGTRVGIPPGVTPAAILTPQAAAAVAQALHALPVLAIVVITQLHWGADDAPAPALALISSSTSAATMTGDANAVRP